MIKNLLIATSVLCFTVGANADVLNPLYVPGEGALLSKTSLSVNKNRYKNDVGYNKTYYKTTASEELQYGLTNHIAIIGNIGNIWQKDNADDIHNIVFDKDDRNIEFSVGALYNFFGPESDLKMQASAVYGQSESWADTGTGAYKYVLGSVKAGYQLGSTMPYISADVEMPIAQSNEGYGHDYFRYFAKGGIYQTICDKIALDAGVKFSYEDQWKAQTYTGEVAVGYNFTGKTAVSVYGAFPIASTQKYDGHLWSRLVGVKLTTEF